VKLGLVHGYWGSQPPQGFIQLAQEAEGLGYDSVWVAEAYGSDCFSPLAWIGAHTERIKLATGIMQISARTPTCVAMTAMTLDHLSNGRLILGVGVSGPQVVEGWYGQPFPKPLARTREYVEILRKALAREAPVTNDGPHYPLPYPGGTGLGKPLKLITHPLRPRIPIYLGAEGPRNVALAAEICDGWLPIFVSPYRFREMYDEPLKSRSRDFDVACVVGVQITDDIDQGLVPGKTMMAFYIGGMGAPDQNFHANLMHRMGFGETADRIQELFLAGKRDEAIAAVPDELVDETSLVGPVERIKDRLEAWRESPVTTLLLGTQDVRVLRTMAELVL
jgi:F420-dependent oxidoreductase-like protein